jgi:hypothetical protein
MKKLLLMMLLFTACRSNDLHKQEVVNREIEYFKDERANLCFGKLVSASIDYTVWSFTCVPCDSVKHLLK